MLFQIFSYHIGMQFCHDITAFKTLQTVHLNEQTATLLSLFLILNM
jgi:hypothetical protein